MNKLKIEYLDKNDLKPYANNAKIHTEEQIKRIRKSIEQFGFNDPIAIWKGNEVIEGHGRLMAVMQMSIDKIPVIRLDNLTEEQRKAYASVHNKLTMNTGFDLSVLEEELSNITEIDMSEYGFDSLNDIQNQLEDFFIPEQKESSESSDEDEDSAQIIFIIKPKDFQIEDLFRFLQDGGYIYET